MSLNDIVANSNYVTDEDLLTANLLGIANTAIAAINSMCGTKLPLFNQKALNDKDAYSYLSDSWLLALIEPYLSYSIMANDGDIDARDFHYNRFLNAVSNFKTNGLQSLDKTIAGNVGKSMPIDVSNVTLHWEGWL